MITAGDRQPHGGFLFPKLNFPILSTVLFVGPTEPTDIAQV